MRCWIVFCLQTRLIEVEVPISDSFFFAIYQAQNEEKMNTAQIKTYAPQAEPTSSKPSPKEPPASVSIKTTLSPSGLRVMWPSSEIRRLLKGKASNDKNWSSVSTHRDLRCLSGPAPTPGSTALWPSATWNFMISWIMATGY